MNNWIIVGVLLLAGIGLYAVNKPHEVTETAYTQAEAIALEREAEANLGDEIETDLLMTSNELADYLGITIEELNSIGPDGSNNLELPFMTIDNTRYYSRPAIDIWLVGGIK